MGLDRKNWCFTFFCGDLKQACDAFVEMFRTTEIEIVYYVIGKELAPTTGSPHLQGYVQFENAVYLTQLKTAFGKEAHWEPQHCKVNSKAADYCKKDGDYVEGGQMVESGFTSDYNDIAHQFAAGAITLREIAKQYPQIYLMYGRRLRDMESLLDRHQNDYVTRIEVLNQRQFREYRDRGFNPDECYIHDRGWVGYHGQKIVYWIWFPDDREDPHNALANCLVANGCEGIRFHPEVLYIVDMNQC